MKDKETENIRSSESGVRERKKQGVRLGRPPKIRPVEFESIKAAWMCGDVSSKNAAKQLGIAQDTFLRWCRTPNPVMTIDRALKILDHLSRNLDSESAQAIRIAITYIKEHYREKEF